VRFSISLLGGGTEKRVLLHFLVTESKFKSSLLLNISQLDENPSFRTLSTPNSEKKVQDFLMNGIHPISNFTLIKAQHGNLRFVIDDSYQLR
jgi:hypothetical protein